jgi:hypothetical protein
MSHPTREKVFRPAALRHDEQPDEEIHRPRLAMPRRVTILWLMVGLFTGGGLAALLALTDRLAH